MVGEFDNLKIVGWTNYLQQQRPPLSLDKRKILTDAIFGLTM